MIIARVDILIRLRNDKCRLHFDLNPSTAWWLHQMETYHTLLALCTGNSPFTGEFPSQRPKTRSSDVFFDLRLNKRLSKQSWGWRFKTPSRSLWRHDNGTPRILCTRSALLCFVATRYQLTHISSARIIYGVDVRITASLTLLPLYQRSNPERCGRINRMNSLKTENTHDKTEIYCMLCWNANRYLHCILHGFICQPIKLNLYYFVE